MSLLFWIIMQHILKMFSTVFFIPQSFSDYSSSRWMTKVNEDTAALK